MTRFRSVRSWFRRSPLPPIAFAWVALAIGVSGCTSSEEKALAERCPNLSPREVRHLVRDSDAALRSWLDGLDGPAIRQLIAEVRYFTSQDDVEGFEDYWAHGLPVCRRLASYVAERFDDETYSSQCDRFERSSPAEEWAHLDRMAELQRAQDQLDAGSPDCVRLTEERREAGRAIGDWVRVSVEEGLLASLAYARGDAEDWYRHTQEALTVARRHRLATMEAQTLGVAAIYHGRTAPESTQYYFDLALARATAADIPEQAGRIHGLRARSLQSHGRFVAAREEHQRALRVWDRSSVPWRGVRQLTEAADFYLTLGANDVAFRLVRRGQALLHQAEQAAGNEPQLALGLRLAYQAAQPIMRDPEQRERAWELLEELAAGPDGNPAETEAHSRVFNTRIALALEIGRTATADSLLTEFRERAERRGQPVDLLQAAVLELSVAVARGEWDRATRALPEADRCSEALARSLPTARCQYFSALLEIAAHDGPAAARTQAVATALTFLIDTFDGVEPGPQAHLFLNRFAGLRSSLHSVLSSNPEVGYEFEWGFRSLPIPRSERPRLGAEDATTPAAVVHAWCAALRASPPLVERGEAHVLYAVNGDSITRWIRTTGGVRSDTLRITEFASRDLVQSALDALRGGPAIETSGPLRRLAEILLPPEASEFQRLLISPAGAFSRFPFGALDVGSEEYTPLLLRTELATLRSTPTVSAARNPAGACLAIAPTYSEDLRREYPDLAPLTGNVPEARLVVAELGGDALLGSDAALGAVIRRWETAQVLWFAGHAVQDPEVPFVTFLPLSPSAEGSEHLDAFDILSADLTACDLVVVTGCATGAPYVSVASEAPSLGGYFVDAGAGAAVSARGRIRDDEAVDFSRRFLAQLGAGLDPTRALNVVRREMCTEWMEGALPADVVLDAPAWTNWEIELARP
ncbi:MAG: CHAT domain-containing protein [bacterium]